MARNNHFEGSLYRLKYFIDDEEMYDEEERQVAQDVI